MIHVGHRFLVMDSDPPAAVRDLPASHDRQPTLFFDVVNEFGEAAETPDHFRLCFANPNIIGNIPPGVYRIVIRADGGDFSKSRQFEIRKDNDSRLMMLPL